MLTASVATIEQLTPDVRVFGLDVESEFVPYDPGGHLDVEVFVDGTSQLRCYSLVGFSDKERLTIAVRLNARGRGGSAYMWSLSRGAQLKIRRARNTLPVTFNVQRYILIAGGIGITPITAVARALHEAGKRITLHYSVRDAAAAPFLRELEALLGANLIVYAGNAGERLDVHSLVRGIHADTVCYMCGPLGLMEQVSHAWQQCDLPREHLRFETFGNSGLLPTSNFEVTVRESGALLVVSEAVTMLDALLASGHDVMYECRRGECGLCKVEIDSVTGTVDHRDVFLSELERARNNAMCSCVSRIYGGSVTIRIDGISHGRVGRCGRSYSSMSGATTK